jgi:outer membrane biosynthesis protein TonB
MLPLPQFDPARVRLYRRHLLTALAMSTVAHVVLVVPWLAVRPAPPAPPPVPLIEYAVDLTLTDLAPAGGGDHAEEPSVAQEVVEAPAAAPEVTAEEGIPVPVPEPVAEDAPLYPLPSAPPPEFASLMGTSAGTAGGGTGGGTGGGDGDGTGVGTGPGASTSPSQPPAPPPLVERPDRSPVPVRFSEPAYPPEAREDGIRARVSVRVLVDERGRVTDARIVGRVRLGRGNREEPVASLPYGMDEAALDAARRYQFRPAQEDGARVRSYTTITCSFGI